MTKEEKIKEVYGTIFETHSHLIDSDGWLNNSNENDYLTMGETDYLGEVDFKNDSWFRPKSLSEIENNYGWIKIESEADLPKEDCDIYFIKDNKVLIGYFYHGQFGDAIFLDQPNIYFYNQISHYQPIQKPELPIY